jgi:hypothetical protein
MLYTYNPAIWIYHKADARLLQIGACAWIAVNGFGERMKRIDMLMRECALQ